MTWGEGEGPPVLKRPCPRCRGLAIFVEDLKNVWLGYCTHCRRGLSIYGDIDNEVHCTDFIIG